jgi:hypothetical protein
MAKATPIKDENSVARALAGLQTALPPNTKIIRIGGVDVSVSSVVTQLKGFVLAYEEARMAEVAREKAFEARRKIERPAQQMLIELKPAIAYLLGATNPALASFGFTPKKQRAKLNSVQLASRAAKAKATRAARPKKPSDSLKQLPASASSP